MSLRILLAVFLLASRAFGCAYCGSYSTLCLLYDSEGNCTLSEQQCDWYYYGDYVTVQGKLRSTAGGGPATGVVVTVTDTQSSQSVSKQVDSQGNYSIQIFANDDANGNLVLTDCTKDPGSYYLTPSCVTITRVDDCTSPTITQNISETPYVGSSQAVPQCTSRAPFLVTGAGAGGGPHEIGRFGTALATVTSFFPYMPTYSGGVRVAAADLNKDGYLDTIVGSGAYHPPEVAVYSGKTGQQLTSFMAYDPAFTSGIFIATGDVNGDGFPDIITGADSGGGPHVKVFDGKTLQLIRSFFAFDASFTGGVRVAAGDIDGDGYADIIVGSGPGMSRVRAFSGKTGAVLADFLPYASFAGGVFVAAGDVDKDGYADIITGAGAGGGPHVKAISGRTGVTLKSFFAYDASFPGGVSVATVDLNRDGYADIITGAGAGGGPHVQVFDGLTNSVLSSFMAYDPHFPGGVFVGGANCAP